MLRAAIIMSPLLGVLWCLPAPSAAAGPIKMFLRHEVFLPGDAVAVELRPGTREAWVSLQGGSLVVVDDLTGHVVGKVEDVGPGCWGLAFSPDGRRAYATNWMANELVVVDAARREVEGKILVGLKPAFVEVSPDGRTAWVSDFFSGELSVVDLEAGTTLLDLDVGRRPMGLAVGPRGRWAYVSSGVADSLTVVDLGEGKVAEVRQVEFAGTQNLALNGDGSLLVAPGKGDCLLVLDPRDPEGEIRRIKVGRDPVGVALGPWSRYAFVTNYGDATLSVVDLVEGRQVQTYPTPPSPMFLAVGPEGRRLFVASGKGKALSVYAIGDTETGIGPAPPSQERPTSIPSMGPAAE